MQMILVVSLCSMKTPYEMNCTPKVRQKKSNLADLTYSILVKWVNISEPS